MNILGNGTLSDDAGDDVCTVAYLCRDYILGAPLSYHILMATTGIFWTVAYLCYIVQSQRHGTYRGIPPAALFLNVTWEFFFAFIHTEQQSPPQLVMNYIWVSFDFIILGQFLWWKVRPTFLTGPIVERYWVCLLMMTTVGFLLAFVHELHDYDGLYMAYLQNLLMSILFCRDAWNDMEYVASDAWSSWIPGILRWIGTAFTLVAMAIRTEAKSPLLMFVSGAIFCWDVAYVSTTYHAWRQNKMDMSKFCK